MTMIEGWPIGLAASRGGNGGKCVTLEVPPHVIARFLPDREEHALAFVVARTILVRLPEVPECDGTVDRRNDLGEADLVGWSAEDVPSTHASFGTNQTGAFQGEQDLLEVRLRKSSPLRDVSDAGRSTGVSMERQRQQRPARIITSGRDPHSDHRRG